MHRENEQLRRAVEELTLLNDLAVAIGSEPNLEGIIGALVRRSLKALSAEQGVVTMLDERAEGPANTLMRTGIGAALRPDQALLAWMSHKRTPLLIEDPTSHPLFGDLDWDEGVRSLLSAPLIVHGELVGALTLYNKVGETGFSQRDARLLTIIAAQSAQAVRAARAHAERDRVLNMFGRHTSPSIVQELLRHEAEPPTRRAHACVLFLDVRGFTTFAETAEPEEVVDYLNGLFTISTHAITERGGIVHQLLGDGFMAFFGPPVDHEGDCLHAVEAAMSIVERVGEACEAGRLAPTQLGIGIHAGEVVAGTVGSEYHKEYKITGDVVNSAARVEGLNKTYDSQVLVTDAVWREVPEGRFEAEFLGKVSLRGRSSDVGLYRLA